MSEDRHIDRSADSARPRRTAIGDISSCGESLSLTQMRLVSGGGQPTATGGLRHGTDYDGDPMTILAAGSFGG